MIKLFSMFSGYGGAEFALKRAGIEYECVGYSEIKKQAIACYNINHPNIKNFGDCTKIDETKLPDFDLLTAGFPCQTFSIQGSRKGFKDTRGTLIYDILRIANYKKPKWILLENVEGLVIHNNGETLKTILYSIKKIGYDVIYKVLDSSNYGVPQNRKRIFFVCKLGTFKFNEFQFPNKFDLNMFIENILEKDININKYKLNEKYNNVWKKSKIKKYKLNHNKILCNIIDVSTFNSSNKIYSQKGISGTLYSSPLKIHDEYNNVIRYFTENESFRLMGFFKDEIDISMLSRSAAYDLSGNGWDVNLVSLIFKNMFKE